MGNEASRPEDGEGPVTPDPFNPYANIVKHKPKKPPPAEPAPEPAQETRPGTARAGHVSAAKQRLLDKAAEQKVWKRANQDRVASAAEIRKPRFPSASTTRALTKTAQTLESQMGALLKTEPQPVQLTPEQVMEEKKAEFVGKLSNFIGKTPKLPTDLALPKVAVLPPKQRAVPAHVKAGWLNKLLASKEEMLEHIRERLSTGDVREAMTEDEVGSEVSKSLGDTLDTFASYQGTIGNMMEEGLDEEFLEQFFMDEETEKQLTTYEKWAVIRHAAEQVLMVYANRSNAKSIESEQWAAPFVMDVKTGAASVYQNAVDSALNQGHVSLLFIDDGRLVETGDKVTDIAALVSTDLWQAIKELAPNKVPSGQRLERLSILGRNILSATVSLETRYGASALKNCKVVLAIDSENEHFVVSELQKWNFFGLQPHHVLLLPLPRFHGFAQDMKKNTLSQVRGSPKLLMGSGYAIYLLNSPGEAYFLDRAGTIPTVLPGTVLDWLKEHKANWIYAGLFSDVERFRPEAMLDSDFLMGAIYCAERMGANMAMDVMHCKSERDVRTYNSIALGRQNPDGTAGWSCNLSTSAMRTVRSYQLLKSHVNSEGGFYASTQRYAFRVSALQRMLADPNNLHTDVQLHGFFAYATMDLGDVSHFKDANCACVLARSAPGPVMSDVVFTRQWLPYAAGVLEEQDRVDEFRQRAIDLIQMDKLQRRPSDIPGMPGSHSLKPGQTLEHRFSSERSSAHSDDASSNFKERKQGLTVVLVLGSEHKNMAHNTMKLARLFIRNIVDRLHVALILGSEEAEKGSISDVAKQVMAQVTDKELEFNGQLTREVIMRSTDTKPQDAVHDILAAKNAGIVVVPSIKLCSTTGLGSTMSSLAYNVAKSVTSIPVLVVKANTSGKWHSVNPANVHPNVARDHLTVMAHLDTTTVAPMVESVSQVLNPEQHDVLFLAKAHAYERPGMLSMRSRRVFVQGRMAVTNELKVEERAYQGQALPELTKAVEVEHVDMLVVTVTGELPISKDIEDLLKGAKTSIFIYRNRDVNNHSAVTQLMTPLTTQEDNEDGHPHNGLSDYHGTGGTQQYYGARSKLGARVKPV